MVVVNLSVCRCENGLRTAASGHIAHPTKIRSYDLRRKDGGIYQKGGSILVVLLRSQWGWALFKIDWMEWRILLDWNHGPVEYVLEIRPGWAVSTLIWPSYMRIS